MKKATSPCTFLPPSSGRGRARHGLSKTAKGVSTAEHKNGQAGGPDPRGLRCVRWQRDTRGLGGLGSSQPGWSRGEMVEAANPRKCLKMAFSLSSSRRPSGRTHPFSSFPHLTLWRTKAKHLFTSDPWSCRDKQTASPVEILSCPRLLWG